MNEQQMTPPPPPGIIASLRAGFDAIARHIAAILFPLTLDLLLWLGPHVRLERLVTPLLADLAAVARNSDFPAWEIQRAQEVWGELFARFNLLSLLRTFPIGISSLLAGMMPAETPFGEPVVVQVSSPLALFGWLCALTLLGWIGGGVYFYWVARASTEGEGRCEASMPHSLLHTILLSISWIVLLSVISLPALLAVSFLALFNLTIAQGLMMFLMLLSLWLILPVAFSPHGIFLARQNAFRSIWSSLRLVRLTLPTSSLFLLAVLVLAKGLNLLWSIPPADSWMLLVGIAGHAFVTTALLSATFIYYRDMQ
ncbi:hypothetical protein D6833_04545, partial [Candidatus Parcubacteria bacterium]